MKKVLTIAGSDSGGGAGIQADLKTFAACGVYGTSAVTAITAQNTIGVQNIFALPADLVAQQINSVMDDIGAEAWKIGMLVNAEIIRVVAQLAQHYKVAYIVLDPVMVAKSGDTLLRKEAQDALIHELFPLVSVVTPNIPEAQALTNMSVATIEDMRAAAVAIHGMGARNIVIKGGHLMHGTNAVDVLYDGKTFTEFTEPFIETVNNHGTGCTFASAIAAELAKDNSVTKAVRLSKVYITTALRQAIPLNIGHGHGPLNHFFTL